MSGLQAKLYFFYLFTWLGWSAWMPFYLATEKHLGFQTMGSYLSIWMFCAIFAYWIFTSSARNRNGIGPFCRLRSA